MLNVGDEIDHESGTFRVEKVEGRRILRVQFQPQKGTKSTKRELAIICAFLCLFVAVLLVA